MSKRQRYLISTLLVTVLMVLVTTSDNLTWRYSYLGVMVLVSIVGVVWSLWENLIGLARIMVLILPGLLSLGAGIFAFLLPNTIPGLTATWWGVSVSVVAAWILKGLFWLAWLLSYYTILATENIYAVSTIRKIPLVRAASVSGLILTLVCGFFIYDGIFSFSLPYYYNGILVGLFTVPLALQSLWGANFELKIGRNLWIGTGVCAYGAGMLAMVLSFWSMWISLSSILIVVWLYVSLGLMHHWLIRRLFVQMVWEYVFVGVLVPLVVIGMQYWLN